MFGMIRGREMGAGTSLERRMNQLFSDALNSLDWQYRENAGATWVPPVDIFEEADSIRIVTEVPGVRPEDVKISIEGNVLTVSGTKQQTAEERTERVHRYERTYGQFERSFTLPSSVDSTKVKAGYEHGVLTVTLPKAEKARPRQIQVEVSPSNGGGNRTERNA